MSRPSGLSSFKSYNVRSFCSTIKCIGFSSIDINIKVKEWMSTQDKYIFEVCVSNVETVFYEKQYSPCIKISGFIEDDNISDNDAFEKIYSLFEYLFVELSLTSLTFIFKGFIDEIIADNQHKVYRIEKPKKKF